MSSEPYPNIEQAILTHATSLNLSVWQEPEKTWKDQLSEEDIPALLENCPHLNSIILSGKDERIIERLAAFPHLTYLKISQPSFSTGKEWGTLKCLQQLRHLDVNYAHAELNLHFFESLKDIPQLESLSLFGCEEILDKYMGYLLQVKQLKSLSFKNCQCSLYCGAPHCEDLVFTEKSLKELAQIETLTSLEIEDCFDISDHGLQALIPMKNLEKLTLNWTDEMTNAGFKAITTLKNLNVLALDNCINVTDEGFKSLIGLSHLRELRLESCNEMGERGVQTIGILTNLANLNLSCCFNLGSSTSLNLSFQPLAALTGLKHLVLRWCRLNELKFLPPLTKLEYLDLMGNSLENDQELCSFFHLRLLKHLELSYTSITDQGLSKLGTLSSLQTLLLKCCEDLKGETFDALASLKDLVKLNLHKCKQLNDQGMKALSSLKQLTYLDLSGCTAITDEGFKELASLTNLHYLNLENCTITDEGLKGLSSLTQLEFLNLEKCHQITDEGIVHLTPLKNLVKLNLKCELLTVKGLWHLAALSKLRHLCIRKHRKKFTEEVLAALPFRKSIRY